MSEPILDESSMQPKRDILVRGLRTMEKALAGALKAISSQRIAIMKSDEVAEAEASAAYDRNIMRFEGIAQDALHYLSIALREELGENAVSEGFRHAVDQVRLSQIKRVESMPTRDEYMGDVERAIRSVFSTRDALDAGEELRRRLADAARARLSALADIERGLWSTRYEIGHMRFEIEQRIQAHMEAQRGAEKGKRRRRGRRATFDPVADKRLVSDWRASGLTKREFERERGLAEGYVRAAQDREKSRRGRGQ